MAGLRVGRPVGVLPPWGVIAVAAPWPMGTQPSLATQALKKEKKLQVLDKGGMSSTASFALVSKVKYKLLSLNVTDVETI